MKTLYVSSYQISNLSIYLPIYQIIYRSINQTISLPINQLLALLVNEPFHQPIHQECSFVLPYHAVGSFPSLFTALDGSKSDFGVKSYAVSMTSLEEVFFQVGIRVGTRRVQSFCGMCADCGACAGLIKSDFCVQFNAVSSKNYSSGYEY